MSNILNTNPILFTVENYLSANQCNDIINYDWKWIDSTGYDHKTDSSKPTSIIDSFTAHVNYKQENLPLVIKDLNKNIGKFLKIDPSRCERPQLTKYNQMQYYGPHWDYFFYGPNTSNNRVATVIIYLNDDFIGGSTSFPNLNLSIRPQQGKLLYFDYNYNEQINGLTMHSADVVMTGTKYIISVWIRQNPWP